MQSAKTPSQSRCEITQILPHYAINGADRLLGGYMLNVIDELAAACAKRYCASTVTTAMIDKVEFIAPPARLGELFTAAAVVTRAGKTSVEVKVEGCVEETDGTKRAVCRAYVVVVSLDENGKPCAVPPLLCETDEEKCEFEKACERDAIRKMRREKNI